MTRSTSRLRGLIAIPVALALLTSCAATGAAVDDGPTVIRVVAGNEPTTINPIYSSTSDAKSWGALYDALVGNDPTTNAANQDGLLYGWERPTDTTWTFKVREGVKFHDGEVFDAAAAAFVINTEHTDPKANLGIFYTTITEAVAVGDELHVTTSSPYPSLPDVLASTMAVAPKAFTELGGAGFAEAPVGTGPYKFDSYTRGGTLSLVANEDYWQGTPGADRLEITWSADGQTRASLVQSGQADLALDLTPQALAVLSGDSVKVERAPIDARYFIYLNTKTGGFTDPDLRRAAALAIDKDAIVSSIFKDGGATAYDYIVGDLFDTPPTYKDAISYDLDEAKKIVASKGSPAVTLTYATGRSQNDAQIGAAVVGMLQAAGFTVTDDPVDFATFLERRNGQATEAAGAQIIYTFRDPDEEFRAWVNSTSIVKTCDPAWYDEKSVEALAAPDDAARQAVYEEMEDRVLNQDVCFIPIVQYEGIWAMSPELGGFKAPRLGTPAYYKLTLG
jgi:peptide/nickel transport system substrate-binding protein